MLLVLSLPRVTANPSPKFVSRTESSCRCEVCLGAVLAQTSTKGHLAQFRLSRTARSSVRTVFPAWNLLRFASAACTPKIKNVFEFILQTYQRKKQPNLVFHTWRTGSAGPAGSLFSAQTEMQCSISPQNACLGLQLKTKFYSLDLILVNWTQWIYRTVEESVCDSPKRVVLVGSVSFILLNKNTFVKNLSCCCTAVLVT